VGVPLIGPERWRSVIVNGIVLLALVVVFVGWTATTRAAAPTGRCSACVRPPIQTPRPVGTPRSRPVEIRLPPATPRPTLPLTDTE